MRLILWAIPAIFAVASAVETFFLMFLGPVAAFGDDNVLLVWGWIGPILGLVAAILVAGYVQRVVTGLLKGAVDNWEHRRRKVFVVLVLLGGGLATIGWSMHTSGDVETTWTEEVRLGDGSSVQVLRTAKGNVFGRTKSAPDGWTPTLFTVVLSGQPPLSDAPRWQSELRPILIDRRASDGGWYLLAEPSDCRMWYRMGRPIPPYSLFTLSANGWVQRPMSSEHFGRTFNMLISPKFTGEDPFISSESVRSRNDFGRSRKDNEIRSEHSC